MAKKSDTPRELKKCPNCGATIFQGPFHRGPIVNGKLEASEELYQCVNCHALKSVSQLESHYPETVLME